MMDSWRYIFILSAVLGPCFGRSVSYNELTTLGISCSPFDTCNIEDTRVREGSKNCHCDKQCSYFGDCCLDAQDSSGTESVKSSKLFCQKVNTHDGYFTIGKCKDNWKDVISKRKCENPPRIEDPLSILPVTELNGTATYKNFHCAVCNSIKGGIKYWKMGILCPELNSSTADYVRHNLTYDRGSASWGVHLGSKFYHCELRPVAPDDKRNLRFCFANVISNCSSDWKDDFIREKCESYTSYLHAWNEDVTYRNAHCALCNNVKLNSLSCEATLGRSPGKPSFTDLLDVGSKEEKSECKEGEVYDSKFKRCQVLSCGLPFLELRDGRCVPKSG